VERKERTTVGVNEHVASEEPPVPTLYIDEEAAGRQIARLERLRRERNNEAVKRALDGLQKAAAGTGNTMHGILDAVRAYATVGEMCDALREVWGEYEETPLI
jgi:methylmalonyl-CoA mutase N-terminal domain/subunit